jgi:hypothetical protein
VARKNTSIYRIMFYFQNQIPPQYEIKLFFDIPSCWVVYSSWRLGGTYHLYPEFQAVQKGFVDWLDPKMKARQFFDTSETFWPTSYKILIRQPENTLNKVQFMTSIKLIHVTVPRCHHRGILEQSTVIHIDTYR